jgi:Family of unknown function (DUF6247)
MAFPATSIPSIPPDATPRAIRAALIGEEVGAFDREYRRVLAEAAETLDLSGVLEMLRRWQRVAWSSQNDPAAHRRMLELAEGLTAGDDVSTEPWHETRARLGL